MSTFGDDLIQAMTVARRVRLKHVFMERFSLADFRELLGVEKGKLITYGNLNQYAIKPALLEVNALSDFIVTIVPEKMGRRVTGVLIGWGLKDVEGKKAAYAELQRPRVGRLARITGTVEELTATAILEWLSSRRLTWENTPIGTLP